jgi:hypothetical protein
VILPCAFMYCSLSKHAISSREDEQLVVSEIMARVVLNVVSGARLIRKKKPLRTVCRGINMKSPVRWISATFKLYRVL